ncbi:Hypothetical Protein FCC1311_017042 [Hondaea fermentalgiana]|uniref:Uncharacterized protein n=1 Tax=Hondaea fermentalgiana TaxID=2315210 RepID=A0A2R5G4K2_9STRA|nr:Hypothetical Protein FCC1311_017042 [Hondaea fermentalgiana]|eukprot:GBG25485.1 Hypothetical Protein FCC1311_017042 [Hondaea fermentalgiana]
MQGDRSSAGKAAHVVELRSSRATKSAEALDEADQTGHFEQVDLDESKGHDSIQGLNTRIDAPREVEGNIHFTHINTKSLGQEARVSSLSDVDAVLEDLDRWAAVDRRLLDELGIAEASLEQDRLRSDESETMIRLRSQCDEWRLRMLEAEGRAAVASEKLARLESAQTSVAEVSALFASHERRMEAVVLSSVAAALESVGDGLRQAKSPGDSSKSPGKNNAAVGLSSASKDKSSSPSREDDSQSAAARKEASLLDKIRSLEKELAATGKERDEAVQREFAVSEKLKAAEVVGNNARAQYEEAVHDLREDMKARLMERQSAEARRISGLEQEVEKLTTSLEAKDHAFLDLQDELARVKQESAAKTQILEDDVARLTRENGNLESTVHASQLELARIKHDLATRRSDEDDLLARLAAFQASQIAAASPPSSPRGARSSSTVAASLSSWWQNA